MLRVINSEKIGVYWSNEDTFYQKYQDGDMLVYWGNAANITKMSEIYPT
jgi:hypothetical protein